MKIGPVLRRIGLVGLLFAVALPAFAEDPKLFGRGPDGLRTAVEFLAQQKEKRSVALLLPTQTFPQGDLRECLVIVVGSAVVEDKDEITTFLKSGGRVLMVSGSPAAETFFQSLGLSGGRVARGAVGRGMAEAITDTSFLSNSRLATQKGKQDLTDALDGFASEPRVKWIRLINRSRYGINPSIEPSYVPPPFEEEDDEPMFNDANGAESSYRYKSGQTTQTFKDSEFDPGIEKSFVRYKAFDTFAAGHFKLSSKTRQAMRPMDTAPSEWLRYEGKLDSIDEFHGGEDILIPSLGPGAVLLSFEVRNLVGDEWRRKAKISEGDGAGGDGISSGTSGRVGSGIFFTGKVNSPAPSRNPAPAPKGAPPDAKVGETGSMGETYNWSAYSRWDKDALNNWYLHLPLPNELPASERGKMPEKLRFTLKYRVAFNSENYLVPLGSANFKKDLFPDSLTVRDVARRSAGLVGGISVGGISNEERATIRALLHAERAPGVPYLPPALSQLDAGGDMKLSEFYQVLSDFFADFHDEGIALIDEYDSFTEAMLFHHAGVCRHRARSGYLIATYFGLPVRLIVSTNHAFLEAGIPDDGKTDWVQVNLGGGAGADTMASFIQAPGKPGQDSSDDPNQSHGIRGVLASAVPFALLLAVVAGLTWLLLKLIGLNRARLVLRRMREEDASVSTALVRTELSAGNYRSVAITAIAAFLFEAARPYAVSTRCLTSADAAAVIQSRVDSGEIHDRDLWMKVLKIFNELVGRRRMKVGYREFRNIGAMVRTLEAARRPASSDGSVNA